MANNKIQELGEYKKELLKSVKNGIISDITAHNNMLQAEKEFYLSMHKYAVTHTKNGEWMTYLPDDNGRVKKKKKTREELEAIIVDFYRQNMKLTMEDLILRWIEYKLEIGQRRNKFKKQTGYRYLLDYHRFFDGTQMAKTDVSTLTETELEDFIIDRIDTFDLTAKAFGGLRIILRGSLNYYAKYNQLSFSPELFFRSLNLRPYFADPILKKQIFTADEIEKIKRYINIHNESVVSYGILFGFYTGMRIGEIAGLKWEDVFDGAVYVHRTEECYKDPEEGYVYQVRDNPKTAAGMRDVILTPQAKQIINRLKELNPDTEYVFSNPSGERIKGDTYSNKLRRICIAVGIEPRAMHKARKTYASNLFKSHVDEALIISQMGHTDIETTKHFYRHDTSGADESRLAISNAISY